MTLPDEVPVMTLPNATLFPQALLPLYIFESRYRQMLADALHSNRVMSVAMRKPNSARETPTEIAGVGMIRVSVAHKDGTSHLDYSPRGKRALLAKAHLKARQKSGSLFG